MENHYNLDSLQVYQIALDFGRKSWNIYCNLSWQVKKVMGDQFIRAVDSIGSNIAEGYGRYHYKDKVKFYYNSRGSLLETKHWVKILLERCCINKEVYDDLEKDLNILNVKLNSYIGYTMNLINKDQD